MSKPNMIFIVSDQHRGDFMGCAGNRIVHTPNMDRMAREGVHFSNAYCNSPLCVPSRMSMMTGQHPHHTDVFANSDYLRSDMPTYAHALGLGGYQTVLCGRMHFVGPDQRHGYQERLVGDITPSYPGGPKTAYRELADTAQQGLTSIQKAGPGNSPVLEYDEQVVSACEKYLAEQTSDQPLFMTVGFYGPHHPYVCPEYYFVQAWEAMETSGDMPLPKDERPLNSWYADWFGRSQADQITDEQLKVARACYAGLVSLTDTYIGRILEAAKALKGDTMVVYVSDHGDMAGDRGMFWKRNMLEGAVRVPMLWYPMKQTVMEKRISSGRTVDAPVSLVDLSPTFTRLAGAPVLPVQDGADLSPLLFEETADSAAEWQNRPVFSELAGKQDSIIRMVVRGGMKLIYYCNRETLLFDLIQDPHEQIDVSDSPDHQEIKKELLELLTVGDWDPIDIEKRINARTENQRYLTQWGNKVGMGLLDLWKQE